MEMTIKNRNIITVAILAITVFTGILVSTLQQVANAQNFTGSVRIAANAQNFTG
jgi:hypothetical protein